MAKKKNDMKKFTRNICAIIILIFLSSVASLRCEVSDEAGKVVGKCLEEIKAAVADKSLEEVIIVPHFSQVEGADGVIKIELKADKMAIIRYNAVVDFCEIISKIGGLTQIEATPQFRILFIKSNGAIILNRSCYILRRAEKSYLRFDFLTIKPPEETSEERWIDVEMPEEFSKFLDKHLLNLSKH